MDAKYFIQALLVSCAFVCKQKALELEPSKKME